MEVNETECGGMINPVPNNSRGINMVEVPSLSRSYLRFSNTSILFWPLAALDGDVRSLVVSVIRAPTIQRKPTTQQRILLNTFPSSRSGRM